MTSIFELTDSSQGLRVGIWVSTISMIADHPFIGIGWGAFKDVYPNYDYYLKGTDVLIYHAHNIYLQYAAEIGIVGALTFFWIFFGTMMMTLELGKNEKYQAIKENILEVLKKATGVDVKGHITRFKNEVKYKYRDEIQKVNHIFGMEGIIADKLSNLSDKFINWLSPNSANKEEIQKKPDDELETLLNEEGTLKKSKDDIQTDSEDEGKADSKADIENEDIENSTGNDQNEGNEDKKKDVSADDDEDIKEDEDNSIQNKTPIFDVNEVKAINKNQIAEGIKFGIGLSFLSMALNGFTDDLLFNIPTSMLMWILVALAAAIESLPEKEEVRRRIKR